MRINSVLALTSFILALTCLVLIRLDMPLYAALVGFFAFALSQAAIKKGSTKLFALISIFAGTALGLALCPKEGFFCLAASMFFLAVMMTIRLLLLEKLNYTRFTWLEPVLFAVGTGYYVMGNLYDGNGWAGWAFPTPAMAFAAFMIMGQTTSHRAAKEKQIERFGVEPGKPAPEISLPDQHGHIVNLSDYKGKRHVLLIFVRGDWCPTCHIMLRSYEKNKEKFASKNIMLLAIGPDNVGVNKEMVDKLGLDYKLLSDEKFEAVSAYGMQTISNNPMTKYAEGIPLPASFLIDINGRVQYTSNPRISGEILNPETILPIVEKLHAA